MELTKNKKRAERRQRNIVAKSMHAIKKGGPMVDRRKKMIEDAQKAVLEEMTERGRYNNIVEDIEKHSIDQRELDLPLNTPLFEEKKSDQ